MSGTTCASLDGGSYVGNGYAWAYQIDLDANETIDPTSSVLGSSGSSYGVIYDIGSVLGLGSTGEFSADFTISTALTTTPPSGLSPTDSAVLLNVVYQAKVGTDINGAPNGTVLGTLYIISATNASADRLVNFIGQAISNATGQSTGNIGSVEAPNLVSPEPATLGLLLAGLVGGLLFSRKRASHN